MTFSIVGPLGPDGTSLGRRRRLEVPRRGQRRVPPRSPASAPSPPRPTPTSPGRASACPCSTKAPPRRWPLQRMLEEDDRRDHRQVGIVDVDGGCGDAHRRACLTGPADVTGEPGLGAIQGNILAGPEVVEAMKRSLGRSAAGAAARPPAARRAGRRRRRRRRHAAAGSRRPLLVVAEGAGYGGARRRRGRPAGRRPRPTRSPSSPGCWTSTTSTSPPRPRRRRCRSTTELAAELDERAPVAAGHRDLGAWVGHGELRDAGRRGRHLDRPSGPRASCATPSDATSAPDEHPRHRRRHDRVSPPGRDAPDGAIAARGYQEFAQHFPQPGLGRALAGGDLAGHPGGDPRLPDGAGAGSPTTCARHRHHQPARDRAAVGPRDPRVVRAGRSSGRTAARRTSATRLRGRRPRGPGRAADRAAAGPLLLRHQADLARRATSRTPGRWSSPAGTPSAPSTPT